MRQIEAEQLKNIKIVDGKVKKIFKTRAKVSGNGAIIYVPKENLKDNFYVVICE